MAADINAFALALLVAMVLVTLWSSRQNAVKALLLVAVFIPLGQMFMVAGLHVHFFRIVILAGLIRVIVRGETRGFRWNRMDKVFVVWALIGVCCDIIRGAHADTFGNAYNALGTYFFIRIVMEGPGDVLEHIRFLALVALVVAIGMVPEYLTHKNPFFILGGIPDVLMERGDRVRCQGPFRIPILAGTFSATLLPLQIGLWFQDPRGRLRATLGIIGCVAVTVFSNSSGPLICMIVALLGVMMWKMRDRMSWFRRGLVVTIVALGLVMKAPVWYLIARASNLVGGGGWHRSFLIDLFLRHIPDWWLAGYNHTATWVGNYAVLLVDPDNIDITNHYVAQGINGGIWMFGLFIALLVMSFKIVGRTMDQAENGPLKPIFIWCLGVTLASHCAAFFSISYFDQIQVFWFWFLGVVSALSAFAVSGVELASPEREDKEALVALPGATGYVQHPG